MDVLLTISHLTTIPSVIGLSVVGLVAAAARPVTWHDKVAVWKSIHQLAPIPPKDPADRMAWEDPDLLLPFELEIE